MIGCWLTREPKSFSRVAADRSRIGPVDGQPNGTRESDCGVGPRRHGETPRRFGVRRQFAPRWALRAGFLRRSFLGGAFMMFRSADSRTVESKTFRRRHAGRRSSPLLEQLESRLVLSGLLVEGAGPGKLPKVQVFDAATGKELYHFLAYGRRMRSGVRVAVGDINGDGTLDIVTAPGRFGPAKVKIFRGSDGALEGQFSVPRAQARGGLWVAAGDLQNTGAADIIVSPGLGRPVIRAYSGFAGHQVASFRADAGLPRGSWQGGARVAMGDLDRDGHADIVAVPTSGRPLVRVLSGATGAVLASYTAFSRPVPGGVSLAVGTIGLDRRLDVIVAAPSSPRSARVRVFDGLTGARTATFRAPGRGFADGVRVAAVSLGGGATDALALAPARGRGPGATVLDLSALELAQFGLPGAGPTVVYRLPNVSGGAFLAGANSVADSTPAVAVAVFNSPSSLSIPPIDRLAIYVPTSATSGTFEPVQPGDPRLVGKDITVLVHGWAPGYLDWVQYEAAQGHVLKWWETFQDQPGYDPSHPGTLGPASNWLLQGGPPGTTSAANLGLAQAISGRASPPSGAPSDPSAVVLAYSWIDDSATQTGFGSLQIPEDADLSEARTTLNGERLAVALETALGNAVGTAAKIQLIGHSHGSKVATVAADALSQAGYPLDQLTILDSPEDSYAVAAGAANFNWFFLQDLPLNRQSAQAPFVDNDISYFGTPYGGVTSDGSYTLSGNLSQVVDTQLYPDSVSVTDVSDEHSYAAWWYTGSSDPTLTGAATPGVGQLWSPLLPANSGSSNPVPGLSPYYQQNWSLSSHPADQQFVLNAQSSAPDQNYTFASAGVGTIDLQQANATIQQQTVSFQAPYYGYTGISFDYQFAGTAPGDSLTVLADGTEAFVMDPNLVGTQTLHATISLSSLPVENHTLTFILTSATANQSSEVTISNVNDFERNLF
jgi:hypothetical protein